MTATVTAGGRGHIRTGNGIWIDFENPNPLSFDVETIAAALSKQCRFAGHTPRFYSVAEHSWLCMSWAAADGVRGDGLLALLLHDAAEAYCMDLPRPLRAMLPQYEEIYKRVEFAIGQRFGIDFDAFADLVKKYDNAMLHNERLQLFPGDSDQWTTEEPDVAGNLTLFFWAPEVAERMFRDCWRLLIRTNAEAVQDGQTGRNR